MKYIATIKRGTEKESRTFDTTRDAEDWLDSVNNNLEYTTTVSEVDSTWTVQDWYFHTKGHQEESVS